MVDEIRQLVHRDGTATRSEIAVLYRSNAQSRVIESALFNAAVPYRSYGGLRFFERAEIKHALAYLRLLENPHDDTSFMRVVNFPARGIGALAGIAAGCRAPDRLLAARRRQQHQWRPAPTCAFVAMIDRSAREQTQGRTCAPSSGRDAAGQRPDRAPSQRKRRRRPAENLMNSSVRPRALSRRRALA